MRKLFDFIKPYRIDCVIGEGPDAKINFTFNNHKFFDDFLAILQQFNTSVLNRSLIAELRLHITRLRELRRFLTNCIDGNDNKGNFDRDSIEAYLKNNLLEAPPLSYENLNQINEGLKKKTAPAKPLIDKSSPEKIESNPIATLRFSFSTIIKAMDLSRDEELSKKMGNKKIIEIREAMREALNFLDSNLFLETYFRLSSYQRLLYKIISPLLDSYIKLPKEGVHVKDIKSLASKLNVSEEVLIQFLSELSELSLLELEEESSQGGSLEDLM